MEATKEQEKLAIDQHSRQAEEFAERYRSLQQDPFQNCFTYSRRRLEQWLDRLLPQQATGLRLLDVGCGTGHHMERYRRKGFEVSGVDGSAEMLREARAINPEVEFRESNVDQLPYPDASFDVIICIEVLRYLPDMMPSVREMARVLKPGGVCLATAAPAWSLNGYRLVNNIAQRLPVSNLVRLKQFFSTSGELRENFNAAGFGDTNVHGVYFGPLNWVERVAPGATPGLLRRWESIDQSLADSPVAREMSNMFLVHAVRDGATRNTNGADGARP